MELAKLIGAKVIEAGEDDEGYPTLLLETDEGKLFGLAASRDAEDNGPGHVFVDQITLDQIEAA